ncbi:MAG: hypothetical protein Q4C50_12145 [Eubacteriales bacterium]|nr:hypothetical protein [Eubacteriales bacterium]
MSGLLKRGAGILLAFAVFVCGLRGLSEVTSRKTSDFYYGEYFDEEDLIDVVILGSSHAINGIFPMEMWRDYGIAAYNFASHGSMIPTSYWVLRNLLDYGTPDMVVVDCYYLNWDEKTSPISADFLHNALDVFPLSVTKYQAVQDLWKDNELLNKTDKIDFLWPFYTYHNRWSKLEKGDFVRKRSAGRGAERRLGISEPVEYQRISRELISDETTWNVVYLKKIIELCQEKGIECLLTFLPYPAGEEDQKGSNLAYQIAEEYGVNYINFLDTDCGIDFETDCWDSDSHLNMSGANKVSAYLGKYIQENYDIADHREDQAYSSWQKDYEAYVQEKLKEVQEKEDINRYISGLTDPDFDLILYFTPNCAALTNEKTLKLLKNMDEEADIDLLKENADRGCLLIKENGSLSLYIPEEGKRLEAACAAGKVALWHDENLHMEVNGEDLFAEDRPDIIAYISYAETSEQADVVRFHNSADADVIAEVY